MTVLTSLSPSQYLDSPVLAYAEELISLVTDKYPRACFIGPTHSDEENLWLIEAYFDDGEDFELQDHLSEREIDILLAEDIWMGTLCLPLAEFPNGD